MKDEKKNTHENSTIRNESTKPERQHTKELKVGKNARKRCNKSLANWTERSGGGGMIVMRVGVRCACGV